MNNRILHTREEWEKIENEERKAQDMAAAARRKIITGGSTASAAVPAPASNQEGATVERLRAVLAEIDAMPMPPGEPACLLLDALELTDQIRKRVRERAKVMLSKEPDSIPGWSAKQCAPTRELSKDPLAIFQALHETDDAVTARRFIASATISIGAIEGLLSITNPDMTPEEITAAVNEILADRIHYRDGAVRLSRRRDQLELPFSPSALEEEVI
jgi:hypothetical protein